MPNFTAEKNMFIVWCKNWFWSILLILLFMTSVRGVNIFITHPFKSY